MRDANGQALSYVNYEKEPGRRTAAGLLTRDEARRIALNVILLRGPEVCLRIAERCMNEFVFEPESRRRR